jgi:hypothetical protein
MPAGTKGVKAHDDMAGVLSALSAARETMDAQISESQPGLHRVQCNFRIVIYGESIGPGPSAHRLADF